MLSDTTTHNNPQLFTNIHSSINLLNIKNTKNQEKIILKNQEKNFKKSKNLLSKNTTGSKK